jgi:hypothetical protein
MVNSQSSKLYFLIEPAIILLIVLVFVGSLLWYPVDKSIIFMVLIGAWFLDGFIKHALGLANETLFADLSFAAFVLTGGRSLTLISVKNLDQDELVKIGVITFFLLLFWLGNLSSCKSFAQSSKEGEKPNPSAIWSVSIFFAILSVAGVLYLLGIQ